MTRPIYWTPARINDAKTAFLAGCNYIEIAEGLTPKGSPQGVRNMLIRQGVVALSRSPRSPNAWCKAEDDALAEHPEKSDAEIAAILELDGFRRTTAAVCGRRKLLGIRPKRVVEAKDYTPRGWPSMPGEPEDRDRMFYQAVIREGVACGAIRVVR